jgi:hypothetical protein
VTVPQWCRKLFGLILSRFTVHLSYPFPLIFCRFLIKLVIENNEFTGVQEFSAPLRAVPLKAEVLAFSKS